MALVCRELELDARQYPPKSMAAQVSNLKNELVDYESFAARRATRAGEGASRGLRGVPAPAGRGRRDGLRRPDHGHGQPVPGLPRGRGAYRRRFRHVLVDEYQDTNHAQYVLVRELVSAVASFRQGSQERSGRLRRRPTDADPGRARPSCASSATRTSRSTRSAARLSATSSSSSRTTRTRRSSCSSRTTARRRTSWPRRTRWCRATRAASRRTCGPTPATARRSPATSPTTSTTRRRSSPRRSTG